MSGYKECQSTIILLTSVLWKGLFSTTPMMMMMEIIMNPMRVPKITAHLDLRATIKDVSAMNRAVEMELRPC
jgi:hypothetical protein